jgi:hypothetical protein
MVASDACSNWFRSPGRAPSSPSSSSRGPFRRLSAHVTAGSQYEWTPALLWTGAQTHRWLAAQQALPREQDCARNILSSCQIPAMPKPRLTIYSLSLFLP